MNIKDEEIPIIESDKNGYWEIHPNQKIWHDEVRPSKNMPKKNWDFVSPFIKGADLPEGEPIEFTVREDDDKECWGWRESKTEYGCEILFPDGEKKLVEFFVNLIDSNGQDKIWTRNSQTFWRTLEKLKLEKGDKIRMIRVGEDKQARYTLTKIKTAEPEEPEEPKETPAAKKKDK